MNFRAVASVGFAIAAMWLACPMNAASQIAFTARADIVEIDVEVRHGGKVVRGLRAEDFDVRDNGVRQHVTSVRFDDVPAHVVLALDMSRSVRGATLDHLRTAVARIVDLLATDDTVAVVGFSDRVVLRAPFTTDRAQLHAALATSLPAGDTALMDAVFAALVLSDDRVGRPFVIVFSDGSDTGSFLDADAVLQTARRTRAVVYGVTSGGASHDGFLNRVSSVTGGRHVVLRGETSPSDALASALVAAKERYLLAYAPSDVDMAGWHELSVRVPSLPDAEIEARPGYLVVR